MYKLRFLVVGLLVTLFLVDTVSAQLLPLGRRRWERRKSELRSELVYDLSAKLDSDLAREVQAVTVQLQATAEAQVKTEAAKLEQQVQEAVAQLRQQASTLVAEETNRLDQMIKQQVTQLQQEAKQTVSSEAVQLKKQAEAEVNRLNAKFVEQTNAMRSTVDQQLANLPTLVSTTLQEELKRRETEVSDSDVPPSNDSTPTETPVNETSQEAATLPPKTEVQEVEE